MTYPIPPVPAFPAGYDPVTADFDNWIQSPLGFCTAKVMFRAQYQASSALTGGTPFEVKFGTTAGDIQEDPFGGWSTVNTGSQPAYTWLCPSGCSGWYEVTFTAFTTNPGGLTDDVAPLLYLDGQPYMTTADGWGVNGHGTGACGSVPVPLVGGFDYIQMYIESGVNVSTTATAGQYPTMEIAWISS